jgi:DNA helicase HerA-like ATPase
MQIDIEWATQQIADDNGLLLLDLKDLRAMLQFGATNAARFRTEYGKQVVRLIRSKGVGVYFVTQSPTDLPDIVLGQLGNRVQHALRAFTPRDQKAVKVARRNVAPESRDRPGASDHRARGGRSARLGDGREGKSERYRTCVDPAALVPDRAHRRGQTYGHPHGGGGTVRSLRTDRRSRIGV